MAVDLFVVTDNTTRWNSTYLAIHRALKLQDRLKVFLIQNVEELEEDTLSEDDWQRLIDIDRILKPFQSVTKHLEGYATDGQHGSVWKALPAIESLIGHLDEMKKIYTQQSHPELATSINLACAKLDSYYKKLDDSPAYAAALMLHPQYRLRYIRERWKGPLKKYIPITERALRKLYDSHYRDDKPTDEQNDNNDDYFEAYLKKALPGVVEDEYKEYSEGQRMVRLPTNLYQWWNAQDHIPSMRQMAFDHISIPAMSAETERVFSDTKLFISDLRSRLGPEIIEALECIRKGYYSS